MSTGNTPALLPGASRSATNAILGAMRAVAETGGAATQDDRLALVSADRYIFGNDAPFAFDAIQPVAPAALASALQGGDLGRDALKFLTIMAFVDGTFDTAKVAAVLRYASALGIAEHYLEEIKEAAQGRLQEALADMTRCNMESITGQPWSGDAMKWFLPYDGAADPDLAQRFEALKTLPPDAFGYCLWAHFKENNYAFPGEPKALNAAFAVPLRRPDWTPARRHIEERTSRCRALIAFPFVWLGSSPCAHAPGPEALLFSVRCRLQPSNP